MKKDKHFVSFVRLDITMTNLLKLLVMINARLERTQLKDQFVVRNAQVGSREFELVPQVWRMVARNVQLENTQMIPVVTVSALNVPL